RRMYGSERTQASAPSRFLREIPGELLDTARGSLSQAGEERRYESDFESAHDPEAFLRRAGRSGFTPARERAPRISRPSGLARPQRATANPMVGRKVRHPTYGIGTIIHVEGEDDECKLTVSFAGHGTK